MDHRQILLAHMRQDEILFVADADFGKSEIVHDLSQAIHLFRAGIARRLAKRLERYRCDGITLCAVRCEIGLCPIGEVLVGLQRCFELWQFIRQILEHRRREISFDARQFLWRQLERGVLLDLSEFDFYLTAEFVGAKLVCKILTRALWILSRRPYSL